jgi:hypothetical protein
MSAPGTDEPGTGAPLPELATLEEPASDRLLDHVLQAIDARQTSDTALELGWWGLTGWLHEMVDFLGRTLGLVRDGGDEGR